MCEIDTATCTADSCSCGTSSGFDYHLGATGRVSGPVLTQFRVNINKKQGGTIVCGGWTLDLSCYCPSAAPYHDFLGILQGLIEVGEAVTKMYT